MSIVRGFRAVEHHQEVSAPLPAGVYEVQITEVDERQTKDGSGTYIFLELTVMGPVFSGRKVFDRIHLVNRSEQAVEIARRQLAALCMALGIEELQDSTDLHGRLVRAKVRVREGRGEYGPSNEVVGYEPSKLIAEASPPPAATPRMPSQPPARRLPRADHDDDDLPF